MICNDHIPNHKMTSTMAGLPDMIREVEESMEYPQCQEKAMN